MDFILMVYIGYHSIPDDELIRIKLKALAEKAKEQGIIICPISEIAPREIPELCNYQALYEPITEDKTYQEYGWYRKFEKKRF